ncbi:uncharacterized protein DS421_9g284460 [Arachis hypogaea]|nr:uncharacterized protein DS421_9g284460 [Arachis hypogaea]
MAESLRHHPPHRESYIYFLLLLLLFGCGVSLSSYSFFVRCSFPSHASTKLLYPSTYNNKRFLPS